MEFFKMCFFQPPIANGGHQ